MFGFNKPKYQLIIPMIAEVELETGGTLSPMARQEIINATYRNHITEFKGKKITRRSKVSWFDRIVLNDEEIDRKYGTVDIEDSYEINAPMGRSIIGIVVTAACLLIGLAAKGSDIANPNVTDIFFSMLGNPTQPISTILLIMGVVFLLPMVRKGHIAYLILLGLLAIQAVASLDSVSEVHGSIAVWIILLAMAPYYWLVRKQVKHHSEISVKQMRAEINAEIDKYLLPKWRRKLNRRNI